jgi:hypothetical protein
MKSIVTFLLLSFFIFEASGCASKKYCRGGRQYYKKMKKDSPSMVF